MTFEDWLSTEIPRSRGYLTNNRLTIGDLVSRLEEHSQTMPAGPVAIKVLLEAAYEAGYYGCFEGYRNDVFGDV